jgi:hypothetical protein
MKEIQEAWLTMTGAKHTSLSTRYNRIKAALARVKDEDLDALKEAMAEATERIEEDKKRIEEEKKAELQAAEKKRYVIVAEIMESKGADKYDAATLEKAWKRVPSESKEASS